MTKIFISWSGEKSNALAAALREWLPHVLQMIEPWMSDSDIGAGHWNEALHKALGRAQFAIVCLTETNYKTPWVNYEVGFLARTKKIQVCPYLIGLKQKDINNVPLSQYQAMIADREGTLKLLKAINEINKRPVSDTVLSRSFEHLWPELEEKLKNLPDEEKLEEAKQVVEGYRGLSQRRHQLLETDLFTLSVLNSLSYSRKGHVTTRWQPIAESTDIAKDWLLVKDETGNPLPAQVDLIDPADPSSAILVFSLNNEVAPSLDDNSSFPAFVTLEKGKQPRSAPDESNGSAEPICKVADQGQRVQLINNRMKVWLELTPAPWGPKNNWYAGSISSVRLDDLEMLDSTEMFKAKMNMTDFERRCLLIDRLQILRRGRKAMLDEQPELINEPYTLVSHSSGPVRASVTILSPPIDCGYWDLLSQKDYPIKCRLQRVISLYKDATSIVEELKIIVIPDKHINDKDITDIPFKVRYFSYIDFGVDSYLTDNEQGWFTVGTTWPPQQGYGFASDRRTGKVRNPHPEFSEQEDNDKIFSWDLTTNLKAKCLHLFRRGERDELQAEMELAWNELIRKPLTAEIIERTKDSAPE